MALNITTISIIAIPSLCILASLYFYLKPNDTPYNLGSRAFRRGRKITQNPFDFGTKEYSDWAKGWTDDCSYAKL